MQVRLFTIPILGGELLTAELNVFLRTHKILQVESQLMQEGTSTFWCFCIKYIEDTRIKERSMVTQKVDYKSVLDEASFARFSKLREVHKKVAQEDAVPAYAVFTDEELAGLAKLESLFIAIVRCYYKKQYRGSKKCYLISGLIS